MINNLLASSKADPVKDGAATFLFYSDRSPGTVSRVETFKSGPNEGRPSRAWVREDRVEVVEGSTLDGSARYSFTPNPDAPEVLYTRRSLPGGELSKWRNAGGDGIRFGERDAYHDPHY